MGRTIRLKPEVVPHKYIRSPPKEKLSSQLSESTQKRKKEYSDKSPASKQQKLNTEAVTPVKKRLFQDDTLCPSTSNVTVTTQSVSPVTEGIFNISNIGDNEIIYKHVGAQVKPSIKHFGS